MRPRAVWTAFGLSAGVTLAAALLLLGRNAASERQRLREEALRRRLDEAARVLWRLESAVLPLFVREASRPAADYWAFAARAAQEEGPLARSRPSPLLGRFAPFTLLHFRVEPDGSLLSPQDPKGALRDRALEAGVPLEALDRAGERRRLLEREIGGRRILQAIVDREKEGEASGLVAPQESLLERLAEYRVRRRSFRDAYRAAASASDRSEERGAPEPFVLDGRLFLLRHVVYRGKPSVQGCWLDAEALCARLTREARTLLPDARVLFPATDQEEAGARRLPLASLPLVLSLGAVDPRVPLLPGSAAIPSAAVLLALLVALAAIAALLRVSLRDQERRTAFVRAVTHELRTPLTTLRMYADLLADGGLEQPVERQRAARAIWRESVRLEHLVENVLLSSRLEALGRGAVARFRAPVGELLEGALERALELCERRGAELEVEVPDAVRGRVVRADPAAVDRILFNLVDNALKYGRPPVRIAASGDGSAVRVTVEDAGEGVDPAVLPRLFRPFVKSDREAARTAPGTGLGLSLSRDLARAMGGELSYESGGRGARFVLELPAAEEG